MKYGSPNKIRIGCVVMLFNYSGMDQYQNTHIRIWDVTVYIIHMRVTINKIDDRSHWDYSMGYVATTGVILYCNPYHNVYIHRALHVWFDEYNSPIPPEDKYNPNYLLIKQDT